MDIVDRRPGLKDITVKTHIKSSAPAAKSQERHDYVNKHSPIWDTNSIAVEVKSELAL
jgi:hypothetical protein